VLRFRIAVLCGGLKQFQGGGVLLLLIGQDRGIDGLGRARGGGERSHCGSDHE
jgi:hypothetical protein